MEIEDFNNLPSKRTQKKTQREKELSEVIKYDKSVKTPRQRDFKEQAKNGHDINKYTIITRKVPTFSSKQSTKSFTEKSYEEFDLENGMSTEDYARMKGFMEETEAFFGFSFYKHKDVLFEITRHVYFWSFENFDDEDIEEIYSYQASSVELYNSWKEYCTFVDKIKPYISLNYPKYSKEQTQVRDILYDSSKLFPDSFLSDICTYLNDYDMHQSRQAKIDNLLKIELLGVNDKNAQIIVDLYIESLEV